MIESQTQPSHHLTKNSPSSPTILENSINHFEVSVNSDTTLRKQLHILMSENFSLKETITSLQNEQK